jgi:hypothetical protein
MKRFTLLLLWAVLILSGAGERSRQVSASQGGSPHTAVDRETTELILAATVRITLIGPRLDESGAPVFVNRGGDLTQELIYDEGLGTAVLQGTRPVVVTHDHWCMLTPRLLQVQIATHDGRLLAILSGFAFRQLIRYRDGGTLIFIAPEGVYAQAGMAATALAPADQLLMAHIQPQNGRVEVLPVSVVAVNEGPDPQTVRLRPRAGVDVAHGSSGGGIWSHSCLAGNLWSVVTEVTADGTPSGDPPPTVESYAALLPTGPAGSS